MITHRRSLPPARRLFIDCNPSERQKMRTRWVLLIALLVNPVFSVESDFGSVCIVPMAEKPDPRSAPGLFCGSEKLSLKIDAKVMPWPIKESVRIDALDAAARHRVVILCDGKPQQSFAFRFSEFKATELCLFLSDLYKTAQLREVKRSPWCKCNVRLAAPLRPASGTIQQEGITADAWKTTLRGGLHR